MQFMLALFNKHKKASFTRTFLLNFARRASIASFLYSKLLRRSSAIKYLRSSKEPSLINSHLLALKWGIETISLSDKVLPSFKIH